MTKILTLDADKLIDALRQRLYLHLEGAECPTIVKEVKTLIVKCAIAPAESAEEVAEKIVDRFDAKCNIESGELQEVYITYDANLKKGDLNLLYSDDIGETYKHVANLIDAYADAQVENEAAKWKGLGLKQGLVIADLMAEIKARKQNYRDTQEEIEYLKAENEEFRKLQYCCPHCSEAENSYEYRDVWIDPETYTIRCKRCNSPIARRALEAQDAE